MSDQLRNVSVLFLTGKLKNFQSKNFDDLKLQILIMFPDDKMISYRLHECLCDGVSSMN